MVFTSITDNAATDSSLIGAVNTGVGGDHSGVGGIHSGVGGDHSDVGGDHSGVDGNHSGASGIHSGAELNDTITKTGAQISKANLLFLATFSFVFSSACLLIFYGLGDFPLFNPDEALYAEPAREMLEIGEYITTYLNYAVRFTKPPLVIWAMTACYQLFGVTEFAARYFGAACGAVLVAITYLFTRANISNRAGIIAAFALMTAPLYLGTSREAITDIPLSLFVTGSMMALFHAYTNRNKASAPTRFISASPVAAVLLLTAAYASIGLAIMTKGPIGIMLPVGILGVYHMLKWDVRSALLFYKPWFGLPLVALIAVPWFAVEISVTKGAYYKEFILRENFQRFTGVVDHKAAWWYHIAAMFGGFFPWSIFLPGAVLNFIGSIRARAHASGEKHLFRIFVGLDQKNSTMLFCLVGSAIILGFFSAGVSKLIPYTLPAFPLLAVLVGGYADELITRLDKKMPTILFGLLAVAYAGALAAIPIVGAKLHDCPVTLLSSIKALLLIHATAALVAAILTYNRYFRTALTVFVSASFFTFLIGGNQGVQAISERWETPIQSFAQFASSGKETLIVYQMRKPSVTFYAKKRFLLPKSPQELSYILSKTDRAYIISKSRSEKDLAALSGTKRLCQMGQYVFTAYARPPRTAATDNLHTKTTDKPRTATTDKARATTTDKSRIPTTNKASIPAAFIAAESKEESRINSDD